MGELVPYFQGIKGQWDESYPILLLLFFTVVFDIKLVSSFLNNFTPTEKLLEFILNG